MCLLASQLAGSGTVRLLFIYLMKRVIGITWLQTTFLKTVMFPDLLQVKIT